MKVGPNQKKVPEKKIEKKYFSVPNLLYTPYGCVSEKQFFFYRKKNWEKNRPTGGCSPPGGTAGGCRARKKKVPKKISKVSPPQKKSARKKIEKKYLMSQTSYTPHMGVFQKNSFFFIEKKIEKKNALQGGV